ncbi:MAG: hypothetical protein IJH41_03640 [Eubacterium sp.]|nr:hypothetical protein [Eubacterium sp.]
MTERVNEMIDGIRRGSQDIGREVRNMDSVRVGIASGWQGESADAYLKKLSKLISEIETVHTEIDSLLEIMR